MATDRLFFALRPDAVAATHVHALASRLRDVYALSGQPLLLEHLHVTLCFLGDHEGLSPKLVAEADAAGRHLRGVPFELSFDRIMSFRRKRNPPLVLCREGSCAPLVLLRHQLGVPDPQQFTPHVTLLYDRRMITLQEVAPISWRVIEVLLIRSYIGQTRHEVLGRYPLG
ncbi:MAG: 2'-5' RNA ligase family protein [Pseudomonadota bacterium]